MDPIKEAFSKIKEDISFLREEIHQIRLEMRDISKTTPTHNSTQIPQQTDKQTNIQTTPVNNHAIEPLYAQNMSISIGNEGVPTDKQTNRQTDKHADDYNPGTINSDFKQVNDILNSLDHIKKGIRLKFKRLTPQEMLIFSTLYSLEEQNNTEVTYRTLATLTGLSESSIRDYVNKLINKGIPIEKIRQNNKTILLKISKDLKNIATLATIQDLREL
jgi:hypothetical protein